VLPVADVKRRRLVHAALTTTNYTC
jgi:hypothetical protein